MPMANGPAIGKRPLAAVTRMMAPSTKNSVVIGTRGGERGCSPYEEVQIRRGVPAASPHRSVTRKGLTGRAYIR